MSPVWVVTIDDIAVWTEPIPFADGLVKFGAGRSQRSPLAGLTGLNVTLRCDERRATVLSDDIICIVLHHDHSSLAEPAVFSHWTLVYVQIPVKKNLKKIV